MLALDADNIKPTAQINSSMEAIVIGICRIRNGHVKGVPYLTDMKH